MPASPAILHVDLDAFFAAVEQLDDPSLRGKPILVGGDGPRSVVSTASYEARPYGCRSAMPMQVAKRLCPHAIVVRPRYERYRELSDQMFAVLDRFTPLVQPMGIDEAFLDVAGSERLFGTGEQIARLIKRQVREETRLTISVGVAPNKFLAKLASDLQKPDGLTVLNAENIDTILPPLPISRMWGIGPKTAKRMMEMGLRTFGDIRRQPVEQLIERFGEEGEHWHHLVFGRDERTVTPDREAKSISQEQTFGIDLVEPEELRAVLLEQTEQVARRVRKHGFFARVVTVKIRDGEFHTITRRQTLETPTDATRPMWEMARHLFDTWAHESFRPVRLIGMGVSGFAGDEPQMPLFPDQQLDKQRKLDTALDAINERFGGKTIHRGRTGRRRHDER